MNPLKILEIIMSLMFITFTQRNTSIAFILRIKIEIRSEGSYQRKIIFMYCQVMQLPDIHINNICWPTEQGMPKTC